MTLSVSDTPPPRTRLGATFEALLRGAAARPLALRIRQPVDYDVALDLQQRLIEQVHARLLQPVVLILEHPLVVTLGRSAPEQEAAGAAAPVWRTHRGGHVTVHGPGQLVAYPIFDLRRSPWTVVPYVRRLEQLLRETCTRLDVAVDVREGLTGLWTERGKIASIGIAVRRGITWHGIALYVYDQRNNFGAISPCALPGVTPDAIEHHRPGIMLSEVHDAFARALKEMFGTDLQVIEALRVHRENNTLQIEPAMDTTWPHPPEN